MEIFNRQNVPCELNLACRFDSKDCFDLFFREQTNNRVKHVLPVVHRLYLGKVVMDRDNHLIKYFLNDITTKQPEIFDFSIDSNSNIKIFDLG